MKNSLNGRAIGAMLWIRRAGILLLAVVVGVTGCDGDRAKPATKIDPAAQKTPGSSAAKIPDETTTLGDGGGATLPQGAGATLPQSGGGIVPAGGGATAPSVAIADEPGTVTVKLGDINFHLEVSDTEELRTRGLMYRESMKEDHGMIFVFPWEQKLSFWMKNTTIALDIVFVNASGKVVSINHMVPLDTRSIPSVSPARWAVEINEGMALRAGLKVGDQIDVPKAASFSAQ